MKQAFTIILDEPEKIDPEDIEDVLDGSGIYYFTVVSITAAPTTTLQQPPPTDKNQPS